MSKSAERAPTPADSIVRNTAGKGSKQATDGPPAFLPEERLREICEKHYNQLLPIMAEKKRRSKKGESHTTSRGTYLSQSPNVFSRLRHGETRSHRQRSPVSTTVFTRLGDRDMNVFTRPGEREKDMHSRLGPENAPRRRQARDRRWASTGRAAGNSDHRRKEVRNLVRRERSKESGHWKSKSKTPKSTTDEEDLSQPWLCEETDPFTLRIRNFEFPKRIRMPSNIKTYDGSGDPEDHLKIFQTAAKIERWAMPTWCHMFNSTLIGSARLWFDELPPESIDSYVALRKAFLANFLQQKKYIKDPVEIYHIKQREGESTEAFMERFKAESMHVKGAPGMHESVRIHAWHHQP
ncbi:reverse transcriptase domain-containing protein [Tanacetum coccineum]